jgi:hypothetical protein
LRLIALGSTPAGPPKNGGRTVGGTVISSYWRDLPRGSAERFICLGFYAYDGSIRR